MQENIKKWTWIASGLLSLLVIVGCGDESNTNSAPATSTTNTASATWLLSSSPGQAEGVGKTKAQAKEGNQVTVVGRIGGRLKPMEPGSPVFLIVDPAIPTCAESEDDHCPTPWDYCCEPRNNLMANSATVQLVGADGSLLETDPVAAGLKPMDEVIVVGTIGPRPSQDVLTIQATGVYPK